MNHVVLLALCSLVVASPIRSQSSDARAVVERALDALGGGERLRNLQSIEIEAVGHEYALEQSERPEGPWITSYVQFTEVRDLQHDRLRRTTQMRSLWSPDWSTRTLLVEAEAAAGLRDGQQVPYPPAFAAPLYEQFALGPERVLLLALAAPDLHAEPDATMQGVRHEVVAFTWRAMPVRVFLHAFSHLPTAVERVQPAHGMDVWGDVTLRTYFSLWYLEPGGLRYPHQWDVTYNGTPYQSYTLTRVAFDVPVPPEDFTISDDVQAAAAQFAAQPGFRDASIGRPDRPPTEIAPGIVELPGGWDVTLVQQADGLVVIEAPYSPEYSEKVLAEAEQRFPGVSVKAVVSTSDAWPHFGGLRTYAARGIPIYLLGLNRPLVERLMAAPFLLRPDVLAQAPRVADLRDVTGKTSIGDGPNRLELYPVWGEGGERMLMVYFPEHRLLYGADLVQRQRDGSFFMPQYLDELAQAVAREGLTVDRVFAMHASPLPWAEVLDAIVQARQPAE